MMNFPFLSSCARWRHQMETFSALLAIFAGNSPVISEFPAQRPVTRSFDVFFDLLLNIRLSKQWWGWWFETRLCPLWRYCNETFDVPLDVWVEIIWWLSKFELAFPITVAMRHESCLSKLRAEPATTYFVLIMASKHYCLKPIWTGTKLSTFKIP